MSGDFPQQFSSKDEFEAWRRAPDIYAGRPLPKGFRELEEVYLALPVDSSDSVDFDDARNGFRNTHLGPMQGVLYLLETANGTAQHDEVTIRQALSYCGDYLDRFPEFRETVVGVLKQQQFGEAVIPFLPQE